MVGGGYLMGSGGGGVDDNDLIYDDGLFDKIEDLLDFSNEEMMMLEQPSLLHDTQPACAAQSGFPQVNDTSVVGGGSGAGDAAVGLDGLKGEDDGTFPCDDLDMVQLEWLSNFVEESFSPTSIDLPKSSIIDIGNDTNGVDDSAGSGAAHKEEPQYRSPSPVSVLEHSGHNSLVGGGSLSTFSSSSSSSPTSSSCSSVGSEMKVLMPLRPPENVVVRGRAPRTKRPRPASLPRSHVLAPFVPPSSEDTANCPALLVPTLNSEPENFAESDPFPAQLPDHQVPNANKKKKKLKLIQSTIAEGDEEGSHTTAATAVALVRKCMHCEITKTPQWRAGPMGPKTLCNACGVRYKSGRLFPEYRPAASPTFVSSQHSNSHKKVIEMRIKSSSQKDVAVLSAAALPVSAKGCELLNYIRSGRELEG